MAAVVSTSAGLLAVLTRGPSYGRALIRRLRQAGDAVNPQPGTIYRALEALVRKGHVRRWTVVPGGSRGGRSRHYYEVTPRGMAAAEEHRAAVAELFQLAVPSRPAAPFLSERMAERFREAAEVSGLTAALLRGVRRASGRHA